jgi:hypothetical protein
VKSTKAHSTYDANIRTSVAVFDFSFVWCCKSFGRNFVTMASSTEELMQQINEKDKVISDLKEKTKAYILKMQTQHQEALGAQQELTKESQVCHSSHLLKNV